MSTANEPTPTPATPRPRPFRRAVLGGLGVLMPPLLTIALFVWLFVTVNASVLRPMILGVRGVLAWQVEEIHTPEELADAEPSPQDPSVVVYEGQAFKKMSRGGYVPLEDYEAVEDVLPEPEKASARDVYLNLVELRYLQPWIVIPLFLCVFILLLYFLGKFLAAGIGRVIWNVFERFIHRVPVVSNVYASVKQVTDFLFTESEIEFNRVVAIEYPRKGIWSLGLVTGESMVDIEAAANEPVLSVLIPSSPMPITGYTITVKKSEAIDIDLTIDQVFQFCISCGVVVPPRDQQERKRRKPALASPSSNGPGSGDGTRVEQS